MSERSYQYAVSLPSVVAHPSTTSWITDVARVAFVISHIGVVTDWKPDPMPWWHYWSWRYRWSRWLLRKVFRYRPAHRPSTIMTITVGKESTAILSMPVDLFCDHPTFQLPGPGFVVRAGAEIHAEFKNLDPKRPCTNAVALAGYTL